MSGHFETSAEMSYGHFRTGAVGSWVRGVLGTKCPESEVSVLHPEVSCGRPVLFCGVLWFSGGPPITAIQIKPRPTTNHATAEGPVALYVLA